MKHEWAAYVAFWICVCVLGTVFMQYQSALNIEIQKTKQMELKLGCKG